VGHPVGVLPTKASTLFNSVSLGLRAKASSNAWLTCALASCPASSATRWAKCLACSSTSALFISSRDCGATVERVRSLHDETMSGRSNASNIG